MNGRSVVLSVACGLVACFAPPARAADASTTTWSGKLHPSLGRAPFDSRTIRDAKADKSHAGFNDETFTALGFSPEGRFAYLETFRGNGDVFFTVVVTNLDDDSEAARDRWHGEFDAKEASAMLEKWKIEPLKDQGLRSFPARLHDDDYDAAVKGEAVFLTSRTLGSKKIAVFQEHRWGILQSEPLVEGFYESPFEKRIVVVSSFLRNGYEGETDVRYYASGAWLAKGFKKKKESPAR